ncbi:MAG: NUDIX hydrolase [candidate division TM6 bacterium GW2011_GWF2_32_72]|nr:MAG: NUDIX hydrolase [candidate division TM6 bacterium GW2011_GWF2_32_72]
MEKLLVQEEILDLVDENDQVIGSAPRSEIYKWAMDLSQAETKDVGIDSHSQMYFRKSIFAQIRGVWLFLVNSKGELWIFRRSASKKICPLYLEGSAVGHVSSGESYEEAVIRETQEELNLDLRGLDFRFRAHLSPFKDGSLSFLKIYELKTDKAPDFSPDEFQEGYWLKPEKVLEMIESGDKCKFGLPLIIKKLYL